MLDQQQHTTRLYKGCFQWLSVLLLLYVPSTALAVYTFDSLSTGNLNGQDDWQTTIFNQTADMQISTDIEGNATKAPYYNKSGSGVGVSASRHNSGMGMPSFTTSGLYAFEVDINQNYWGTLFGVAYDTDSNQKISRADTNEHGVRVSNSGRSKIQLFAGSGGYTSSTALNGDWTRLRVVMDTGANSGQGAGCVLYKYPTTASDWTVVNDLQLRNLDLDGAASDARNPTNWDKVHFHTEGTGGGVDNIAFETLTHNLTDITLSNNQIHESYANGARIGLLSATANSYFTLVAGAGDTDNGSFSIDGNILKLNTGSLDIDSKSSYSIRIRASRTDTGDCINYEKQFTIQIVNYQPIAFDNHINLNGGYLDLDAHVGDFNSATSGTIEGWFKTSSTATQVLFGLSTSSFDDRFMMVGVNDISATYSDESFFFEVDSANSPHLKMLVRNGHGAYSDGRWHHFAVITGDGNNRIIIDGIEQLVTFESGDSSTVAFADMPSSNTMRMGQVMLNDVASYNFTGTLQDIRIWNSTRSNAQIQSNFLSPLTGSETGLIGYWKFNLASDPTLTYDNSSNSNHITLQGSVDIKTYSVTYLLEENQTINFALEQVVDLENANLTYAIDDNGSLGTASFASSSSNVVTYAPNTDETGNDSFTYTVSDGTYTTDPITVNVVIKPCDFVVSSDADDGANTLREATTKLCSSQTSEITFASDMTIELDTNIALDKDVIIDGQGYNVVLDGKETSRIFYSDTSSVDITLKNLQLTKGNGTGDGANYGGAINLPAGATLRVEDSVFTHNVAPLNGGVINAGSASMVIIENSDFSDNQTESYGGVLIFSAHGQLTINNSTFHRNTADQDGGVLYIEYDLGSTSDVTIQNSTFANNSTLDNGGSLAFYNNATNTISNSTFYQNSANTNGGGIYAENGQLSLTHNSFVGHSANEGNSLYLNGTITHAKNNLFTSGTGNTTECAGNGTVVTDAGNLSSDNGCGMTSSGYVAVDTLADNGGDTPTIALLKGSIAVDAGDNTYCTGKDQRGISWTDGDGDGTLSCDVGAYAYQGGLPDVPTGLVLANLTDTFALIVWDEDVYAQQYRLYRTDWIESVNLEGALYSDSEISCGQTYTYQVSASNAYGQTTPAFLEVTTPACVATEFTATPLSATEIELSWNDEGQTQTGYQLLRDDALIAELAADSRSYNDNELTCDTAYSYQLIQQTAQGDSQPLTATVNTDICAPTAPNPPTEFISNNVQATAVTLQWTDNSDDETRFVLTRNGEVVAALPPDSNNHTDNTISCGTTYEYTLLARNDNGDSEVLSLSVTTADCAAEYTLSLNVDGAGQIQGCGTSCQQIHAANTQLTLTPQPDSGWQFDYWSGACDGNGQVTLTTDLSCTAHFSEISTTTVPNNTGSSSNNSNSVSGDSETGNNSNGNPVAAGGNINGSVDNSSGTATDVTVNAGGSLSGGTLAGDINNGGEIADVTVAEGATVNGGTVSGTINNQGTLQDVSFDAGARVLGGTVAGIISGDPDNPAYLGDVTLESGTVLENVHLSPTTPIPEGVILGDNVTFPARPLNPTPQDYGIDPETLSELDAEAVSQLEPAALSVLLPDDIAQLTPAALSGLSTSAVANLTPQAVAALTPAQFNQLTPEGVAGLTSDNLNGLQADVIAQLSAEQVAALDVKAVQDSDANATILTNLDADQVDEAVIIELIPEDWTVDLDTGKITPAVGAKLGFRAITLANVPSNVSLPSFPDLQSVLALGGESQGSPTLDNSLRDSLTAANLAQFVLSQTEQGILLIEGTGEFAGVQFTFMPDIDNMIQVDKDKIPVGLATTDGGFHQMTTPEGYQFVMIPAPQDPLKMAELLGETGELQLNPKGDVWLSLEEDNLRRSNRVHRVVIFDPFIEQAPADMAVGIYPDQVVYPGGIAQKIHPTFPAPEVFISTALKIPRVEDVFLNVDGSCHVRFEGRNLRAVASGLVERRRLAPGERVFPSVRFVPGGMMYELQEGNELLQTFFAVE